MGDRAPRISRVTGTFFKKGKCTVCGGSTERTKSISADTEETMMERGRRWTGEPLKHRRCE